MSMIFYSYKKSTIYTVHNIKYKIKSPANLQDLKNIHLPQTINNTNINFSQTRLG